MKLKSLSCLALALSCALMSRPAVAADTHSLRVVVKASKTDVRVQEPFKVSLRVENPTTTNQTVRVMNCSWEEQWKCSNTNVSWTGWACTKNFAIDVKIPPGGAYTNEMEMLVLAPVRQKTVSFRMGFTPIGSPETFWSNDVKLNLAPTRAATRIRDHL